jgi:hypothetical protein
MSAKKPNNRSQKRQPKDQRQRQQQKQPQAGKPKQNGSLAAMSGKKPKSRSQKQQLKDQRQRQQQKQPQEVWFFSGTRSHIRQFSYFGGLPISLQAQAKTLL